MALLKNLASLTGAEIVSKLLTFAAFAHVARVAGPDAFGMVEFAGAVLLCASLIVDQGFSPYGAREIAKSPQRTAVLAAEIVGVRCVLALAAYGGIVAFAWGLERSSVLTRLILLYGLSLFAMPFLLQWVFQGHDRMQVVAAAQVIRQGVFAIVVLAGVRQAGQIWLVAVAEVAGTTSAAAYSLWMYARHFGKGLRPRLAISRQLCRESVPIGLSQMLWVVRMVGATLIVGLVATADDLGLFAGAQRILVAAHAFVWLYFFNLLPALARAWQDGRAAFAHLLAESMHGITWLAAASGVVWIVLAPTVMSGVYGSAFAAAGPTLACLAGVCVAAAISGPYRFGLIAAGYQTTEMVTAAVGAFIAVAGIPLGYRLSGPQGAAMALCAAELAVWLSAWWCARQLLGASDHASLLVRPALAALVALIVATSSPTAATLRAAVAGACVVAIALALDRDARRRLRAAVTAVTTMRRQHSKSAHPPH